MNKSGLLLLRFLLALLLIFSSSGYARDPQAIQSATELVVVTTADWNAVPGTLQRYERAHAGGKWRPVGEPVTVVVGKNGLGWGSGVDPTGVREPGDPIKKEGDGKAPAGIFRLSSAFGYAGEEQSGWRMPYISLTPSIECVDDAGSKFYNRVVDRASVSPDWKSSEHMRREDELYRWGIVVDHNANPPKAGEGSCIFLHIWRGPGQGTVGCTAMSREQMEALLAWLDPTRQPLLVQAPASQYQQFRHKWHLPLRN
ncbi:MAG TPA: L,D-transpeptidase family protein [Candidatus Angelobacter sp.]